MQMRPGRIVLVTDAIVFLEFSPIGMLASNQKQAVYACKVFFAWDILHELVDHVHMCLLQQHVPSHKLSIISFSRFSRTPYAYQ